VTDDSGLVEDPTDPPSVVMPVRTSSPWRWTWRLALVCALLDVVALISASTTKNLRCADGYTDEGDNVAALGLLVIPIALATVAAGAYTAARDRQHRRAALLLLAAVVVAGAITLVVGDAWMSGGPYLPCND
jgi:NADH:ubiquinone oxidoreductase subunit 2 (subunit N)